MLTFLPCHQLSDILVFRDGGVGGGVVGGGADKKKRKEEKKEQMKYAWHLEPGYNAARAL